MCCRFIQTPFRDAASLDFPPAGGRPAVHAGQLQPCADPARGRGAGSERRPLVAAAGLGAAALLGEGEGPARSTINARIQTVATKPAFRSAFKARRCLIPMAGYYEWSVSAEDGNKDP
ncbi:SOS response-associated peptidase family protein [Stenotrophomonas rhizophila]